MKYLFSLILILTAFTHAIAQDESDIRSILSQQQQAWNSGNIDAFMDYYWESDSLRFMTKQGVTRGWMNTLERYKKGYPDKASMGNLDFDILSVELLSADAALVTGRWQVTANAEQNAGHFNLLFRKKQGRWLIVLDHTS